MFDFSYHNPTKIIFGKNQLSKLAMEIPRTARILITYGGGSIKKNGIYEQVCRELSSQGYFFKEFGGIEPNPTYETLMNAVEMMRGEKLDFLLAVGGGSVIDGTKFISAAVPFDGDPWQILAERAAIQKAIPFASILTLPATGSEMNSFSVITRGKRHKLAFSHPAVFPQFSILDPTYTYTLPPRQLANGVVDAFVHVMEQYLTYPNQAPLQDRYAEGILQTLIEEGPKTLSHPTDYDARANIMWCATQALNGLIGSGVPQDWSTHMIGHEITALHGLDHAQTLAIILPAMMSVRRQQKQEKLLQYAHRVWKLDVFETEKAIDMAILKTREFFELVGNKTHLRDYGIDEDAFHPILKNLEEHGLSRMGEKGEVDLVIANIVLRAAL